MAYPKVKQIKKVLLLNPFTYNSKVINIGIDPVVSRHAGQEIKTGVTFPIGLAYMGAMLRRAVQTGGGGCEIRIIDPIAETIPVEKIYDISQWADAIVMPYSSVHGEHIQKYFFDFRNKFRIVAGGIARHIHAYIFQNDIADVILNGEPEETIVELAHQFPDISDVKGIIYKATSGESVITQARPAIENLDSLPFPLRDFADPHRYWDISFFGRPTAWILPTRGCPFKCIFCAQQDISKRRVRKRSPGNIVDEIDRVIKEQGVRDFVFFDETFNLDSRFNIAVCEEILKKNLKIKWWCAARPVCVYYAALKIMKKSGCIEMRFGIESANDEILSYLGKDTTVAEMRKGIEITKKCGMNFSLQCIFGSPMESEETMRNTMNFIRDMKPLYVSFNVLTPLPGSALFEQLKDKFNLVNGMKHFDILHTDYPLGRYSSQELADIIKRAYLSYYLSSAFIAKVSKEFVKNPQEGIGIIKTMLKQAFYIYKSIVKDKKADA